MYYRDRLYNDTLAAVDDSANKNIFKLCHDGEKYPLSFDFLWGWFHSHKTVALFSCTYIYSLTNTQRDMDTQANAQQSYTHTHMHTHTHTYKYTSPPHPPPQLSPFLCFSPFCTLKIKYFLFLWLDFFLTEWNVVCHLMCRSPSQPVALPSVWPWSRMTCCLMKSWTPRWWSPSCREQCRSFGRSWPCWPQNSAQMSWQRMTCCGELHQSWISAFCQPPSVTSGPLTVVRRKMVS